MPRANPTSPTRLTMNAFLAARAADRFGYQAPAARVVGHVAHRVEVDEHADRRHDDEEAGCQLVDVESHLHLEGPRRDPGPERDPRPVLAEAAGERLVDDHHRDRPGGHDEEERDQEGEAPDPPSEERREDEAGKGQDEQQRHEVDDLAHGLGFLGGGGQDRGGVREKEFEHAGLSGSSRATGA